MRLDHKMTTENLILASYIISIILVGGIALNSYNSMRRAEALLDDLTDNG